MKAIVIKHPGGADVLQLEERPTPAPLANEVLIRVQAAGVNRSDIDQCKGAYFPLGVKRAEAAIHVADIMRRRLTITESTLQNTGK